MTIELLTQVISGVLKDTPHQPFLCLPLSAFLYADLKDNHGIDARLITGDLYFKGSPIFKQDFSVLSAPTEVYQSWAGHAWVSIDDLICDLSIFRTLYAKQFSKPCKKEMIQHFGMGRGCLIGTPAQMESNGLRYKGIDQLTDELALGIIKGFETLLKVK